MKNSIETSSLSKYYFRGEQVAYQTLRDTLATLPNMLKGKFQEKKRDSGFWALKDVSFSIAQGEVVGLIGRNGAGKSTLLKILSRITPPTKGSAALQGRLGSLLEVGTGFHFELTGRENIYLYGSILGMKRADIDRQFDQIVDFAEVEKFLDTPLKHYSSGMYLRLAFAVAAHLDTEILLVDEVLAVGDVSFQQKSVKKMGEVAKQGKTVIFVSHNMSTVASTCKRSILLEKGKVIADGKTEDVIKRYLLSSQNSEGSSDSPLSISRIDLSSNGKRNVFSILPGQELNFDIHYQTKREIQQPYFILSICHQNQPLVSANMLVDNSSLTSISGKGIIRCQFPTLPLLPGVYDVSIRVIGKSRLETFFLSPSFTSFTIMDSKSKDKNQLRQLAGLRHSGPVFSPYSWIFSQGSNVSRTVDVRTSPV